MLCKFRNCTKAATCSVAYYFYDDADILCAHHKELLSELCRYYHCAASKDEELKLRRMCLYLYNTGYADYGHCERAQVRICMYCHVIDYVDFLINSVNESGVCRVCEDEKKRQEEKHKDLICGWDASGQVIYQNGKWKFVAFFCGV